MLKRKVLLYSVIGIISLCILAAGVSALSNLSLPAKPEATGVISPIDKARLAETLHLKEELGEEIWPGWGQMEIPVLLWTEEYSFLIGFPIQPIGWDEVQDDTFNGQPYYQQETEEHENFAVLIDDVWAASLATKWEMDNFMISQFSEMLPSPINKIIPYRLFIQPSEVQITGVLHETFHVYQAILAPKKLEMAEDRYEIEEIYWEIDEQMGDDWQEEVNLLAQALEAETDDELIELISTFLEKRQNRRDNYNLDEDMINFERLIEWEEGLAKYVEVAIWKQAHSSPTYQPLSEMAQDPDFKDYKTFEKRWQQEIMTMKNQANQQGDTRFYYTGMAQAFLLDKLKSDWKTHIMREGVWLDDLLQDVIENMYQ
jgi:hypothetical protein